MARLEREKGRGSHFVLRIYEILEERTLSLQVRTDYLSILTKDKINNF